jgi:hypothetical protein
MIAVDFSSFIDCSTFFISFLIYIGAYVILFFSVEVFFTGKEGGMSLTLGPELVKRSDGFPLPKSAKDFIF